MTRVIYFQWHGQDHPLAPGTHEYDLLYNLPCSRGRQHRDQHKTSCGSGWGAGLKCQPECFSVPTDNWTGTSPLWISMKALAAVSDIIGRDFVQAINSSSDFRIAHSVDVAWPDILIVSCVSALQKLWNFCGPQSGKRSKFFLSVWKGGSGAHDIYQQTLWSMRNHRRISTSRPHISWTKFYPATFSVVFPSSMLTLVSTVSPSSVVQSVGPATATTSTQAPIPSASESLSSGMRCVETSYFNLFVVAMLGAMVLFCQDRSSSLESWWSDSYTNAR